MSKITIEGTPVGFVSGDEGGFPFSISGHLLLVYEDDTGNEFVLRGGPTPTDLITDGSRYGALYLQYTPIEDSVDRRIDADGNTLTPEERGSTEIPLGTRSAEDVIDVLLKHATNIHNKMLPYDPEGANSNGTIGNLLALIGVNVNDVLPDPDGLMLIPFSGKDLDFSFDYSINATDGNDILVGRVGSQIFNGLGNNDQLIGGADSDTYKFSGTYGKDTIIDDNGVIEIDGTVLSGTAVLNTTANKYRLEQDGKFFVMSKVNDSGAMDEAGNHLRIAVNDNSDTPASSIIIKDFVEGTFGITLNSDFRHISLISGLGGEANFGEWSLPRNDDLSTSFIDTTSIFEDGINFFGREFTGLWINNNGSVTFNGPRSTFTPSVITGVSGNPEITPYFADVDTRGGATSPTFGGNSTGSNLVYYDFDTASDRLIVTWDDVGYFSNHIDKLNAFQLILTDRGRGDFDIEFRYEDMNWTTGGASGGANGLGGTVARAGYTAGTGDPRAFFELPASGNQEAMLALDETVGNTGDTGRWTFNVRSGDVVTADIPPLPPIGMSGWTVGDPHLSTLDGVGYDFQAAGEFVLLHGVSDPSFEIQARMVPMGNNISANSAVATNLSGVAVMVDAQDTIPLHVAGIATTIDNFSSLAVGNDRIFREDDTYTIVYAGADGVVNAGDSRLIVDVLSNRVDIDVRLNTEMAGDLEGLLGDGDGNPNNDIALANGTVLDRPLAFDVLYGQYRDDWRVSNIVDSLFTYDTGESLADFYLPAYPNSLVTLDSLEPAVREAAELAALNAGLSPGSINFNNAVLDFALTGDNSYITSSLDVPIISESNFVPVTEPHFNEILGTTGRDNIIGTPDNDRISSLSGNVDQMTGGAGADIFVFSAETVNGIRERDIILDYEVGVDSILLEDGATVGSIRQTTSGVVVFLEGDQDAIYVQGDGVLVGNLTFIPENILLAG